MSFWTPPDPAYENYEPPEMTPEKRQRLDDTNVKMAKLLHDWQVREMVASISRYKKAEKGKR